MPVVGKENSLVVQCALALEARAVAARLKRARHGSLGLFEAWEGTLEGVPVLVVVSGMGTSEAAIAASEVIRLFDPCGLIDFGTAGALSETWAIGKVALVGKACAYHPPRLLPRAEAHTPRHAIAEAAADPEWLKLGEAKLRLPAIKVGSAQLDVNNPHLARYLALAYGFDWVDWESYSVLSVAARYGVRSVGLRTVSDHCGSREAEQFRDHARRVLGDAAKLLVQYVAALHEAQLLGPPD